MCDQCAVFCNDLGSSRKLQLGYVGIAALDLLLGILGIMENFIDHVSLARILGMLSLIVVLLAFISFWIMVSSRCCAPCICDDKTPDVPQPCPIGPCALNNQKLLDYPLLILFAGSGEIGILLIVAIHFIDAANLSIVRLWRLLWLGLAVLGIFTGIMKWKLMRQSGGSKADATTITPVVGEPIQAAGEPIQAES